AAALMRRKTRQHGRPRVVELQHETQDADACERRAPVVQLLQPFARALGAAREQVRTPTEEPLRGDAIDELDARIFGGDREALETPQLVERERLPPSRAMIRVALGCVCVRREPELAEARHDAVTCL